MSITALYYPTQVFFTTLFNCATLLEFVPLDQAHPTKHQMHCSFLNHALTPIQCDVPVHMQCNASLHVISCHMYNECYTDNSNHTVHHVSWIIILIAYNFRTITHSMSIYLYTHISTSYHTTTNKHVIQNQETTPFILLAKCDIYYAHKTVHKTTPRQAIIHKTAPRQAINKLPNQPSTGLNHALNKT